jgi:hypothetical protein
MKPPITPVPKMAILISVDPYLYAIA